MRRLLILLTLCALWFPVSALLRDPPAVKNPLENWELVLKESSRETVLTSGRESLFLLTENQTRAGNPVARGQFADDVHANPDRVRVLVLGDSLTFGHGAYDLDMRWTRRLEEELVGRVGDGVFEIVTIAQNGASLVTAAGWVRLLEQQNYQELTALSGGDGSDASRVFAAPFDALVLGFVGNDIIVDSGGAFVPADQVKPYDPATVVDVQLGRAENPNAALVDDAIRYIGSQFSSVPKIVLPLNAPTSDLASYENFPPFHEHGFVVAANPATSKVFDEVPVADQMVSPVDPHPSALLTRAFAVDAADALLAALGATVDRASNGASPIDRPLVSNALPGTVRAELSTSGRWRVSFEGVIPSTCMPLVGGTIIMNWRIECPSQGSRVFVVDDTPLAPQFLPCLALQKPHVAIFLDRLLPAGSEVTVTLLQSSAPGLTLHTVGYSDTDQLVTSTGSPLAVGKSVSFPASRAASGFLLAFPGKESCGVDAAIDEFPAFTLEVTAAP